MKLVVISDIHGNLEAFTRVLDEIDRVRPDRVICLGDNIGYGPDSNRVVDRIRERGIESVLGNHEMAVKDQRFLKCFNPVAQESVRHMAASLTDDTISTIRTFEKSLVKDGIRFVHGVPEQSPFLYLYQFSDSGLAAKMRKMRERICFVGHTHELELIRLDTDGRLTREVLNEGRLFLESKAKYIVNAGSVGQPRDGDNNAKMVVYDSENGELEVVYVPYPFRKTAEKIIQSGLPRSFADKLYGYL